MDSHIENNILDFNFQMADYKFIYDGMIKEMENTKFDTINKKILLINDDEVNRFSIKKFLDKEKFYVIDTSNGNEALEYFTNYNIGLVLIELHITSLDRLLIIKKIREIEKSTHLHVPIIAMVPYTKKRRCQEVF